VTLIYDGDCAFCRRWVDLVRKLPARFDVCAYQELSSHPVASMRARRFGLTAADFAAAVHLVDDDRAYSGHEACNELLRRSGGPWKLAGNALSLAPVAWMEARAYDWIARNRSTISRILEWRKL
jgi:predicted DCC family thiol-disulfide oxidoreductase YuxK